MENLGKAPEGQRAQVVILSDETMIGDKSWKEVKGQAMIEEASGSSLAA